MEAGLMDKKDLRHMQEQKSDLKKEIKELIAKKKECKCKKS